MTDLIALMGEWLGQGRTVGRLSSGDTPGFLRSTPSLFPETTTHHFTSTLAPPHSS